MKRTITSFVGLAVALAGLTGCYPNRLQLSPPPPPAPIVNAAPTSPIPYPSPPAPPPIPSLTAATATAPPANRIADPVTSTATCGDWHQQTKYGDRWSTTSTWWEYSCSYTVSFWPSGGCDSYCLAWTDTLIDYYHWDGANAVFTGQSFWNWNDNLGDTNPGEWVLSHWWDATAAQWYDLGPTITSITPASGPVGTVIDIQGWNFNGATSVTTTEGPVSDGYPIYPLSYTVDSNSEIHATVPNSATTGQISVTTPDGTAVSSTMFTVTAP